MRAGFTQKVLNLEGNESPAQYCPLQAAEDTPSSTKRRRPLPTATHRVSVGLREQFHGCVPGLGRALGAARCDVRLPLKCALEEGQSRQTRACTWHYYWVGNLRNCQLQGFNFLVLTKETESDYLF